MSDIKMKKTQEHTNSMVQSYFTSLQYLYNEARNDGLSEIANIMQQGIHLIELWTKKPDSKIVDNDIVNMNYFNALEFLWLLAKLPAQSRKDVALFLINFEEHSDRVPVNAKGNKISPVKTQAMSSQAVSHRT